MENVVQIISTVGFPIACCIGMAWYIKGELGALRKSLDNNTLVIQKLYDKLDKE